MVRSLVTLRGLTHVDTGGIVAAPTTSLPEDFGGERNWDYRYCWLRDAALTLESLIAAGRVGQAHHWRDWLLRAIAGDPQDMQVMYTVEGGRHLPERELDHLAGYAGSRPVRIGNGAVKQRQTDVLGEVMCALAMARNNGVSETRDSWSLQRTLVAQLAESWQEPDNGLWEVRGPLRRFTHSRVMVWAAFDRAVEGVERHGLEGPVDEWRKIRDAVHAEVLEHGFDRERNTFTQHYDTDEVDASLLVLPTLGFVEGDDPRMLGTIEAVEKDLMRDGLLLRYRTTSGVDGLGGDEHPFLACSFWLVSAYARAGRVEDAEALMKRLVGLANDVGLLSEEYDVSRGPDGRQLPPGVLPSRPGRSGHAGGQGIRTTRTKRTCGLVRETSVTALVSRLPSRATRLGSTTRVAGSKNGKRGNHQHATPRRLTTAQQDLHQRDRQHHQPRSTRFRTRAQSCPHNSERRGQAQGSRDTADPEAEDAHARETVAPQQAEARPEVTIPVPTAAVPTAETTTTPRSTSRRSRLRTPHGGGPATGPGCSPACSCCWPSAAPPHWPWTTSRTRAGTS